MKPNMAGPDLNQLTWFQIVAEERSFTKAAARIGVAQSTLSHAIGQLEARLGIRLLTCTTRSVAPTAAGERLLQMITPRLAEIEQEIESLTSVRDRPAGSIRLTLSDHALDSVVWPKLKPVLAAYPDLYAWEFEKDGQALLVRVDGQVTFNNSYVMIDAAVSGLGIAYVPEDIFAIPDRLRRIGPDPR